MEPAFTPSHRGGSGPPLVLLHGFTDTWRTWELVLDVLQARHDVLALTLPGHAGGPELARADDAALLDELEHALDAEGIGQVDLAGNSLGGYLALRLAERGRARRVVALAPAGGWASGDPAIEQTRRHYVLMHDLAQAAASRADAIVATPEGRRRVTELSTVAYEHIPPELIAHQVRGAAACAITLSYAAQVRRDGWRIDPARISCPVRLVWGTSDRILRYPGATARYREWLPSAEWVELTGVGHLIQLDVPARAAELIDDFTGDR